MGEKFYDLFKRSIIIQSIVTVMMIGTLCTIYLVPLFKFGTIENVKMPDLLVGFIGLVLGYWFKSRDQYNNEQKIVDRVEARWKRQS